jgi:hypothetical protein
MNPAELADHWKAEAQTCLAIADSTRSLDLYVREHARSQQLRQCAVQLRLAIGAAAPDLAARKLAIAVAALREIREAGDGDAGDLAARAVLALEDIADARAAQ